MVKALRECDIYIYTSRWGRFARPLLHLTGQRTDLASYITSLEHRFELELASSIEARLGSDRYAVA
jgi:hypothetical protein